MPIEAFQGKSVSVRGVSGLETVVVSLDDCALRATPALSETANRQRVLKSEIKPPKVTAPAPIKRMYLSQSASGSSSLRGVLAGAGCLIDDRRYNPKVE